MPSVTHSPHCHNCGSANGHEHWCIRRRQPTGNTADAVQVGGDHYKGSAVQPWAAMEAWMSHEEFCGFLRGNAIKYLARCNKKGGVEDLKKARHYIDKLVETIETKEA